MGVEPPEKLPSLSPPGQGHHSKVRAQAIPNPAPLCARPLRPQPPGQPGPRSPRRQTESQHAPAPGGCEAQRRVCGAAWETVGCCASPAGPGWLSLRTLRSEQPPELLPSPHGCHLPGLELTEGEPAPKGLQSSADGPGCPPVETVLLRARALGGPGCCPASGRQAGGGGSESQ